MVGDEASNLRSMLELNYPMENGIIRSWDDMCHLWDYTFGKSKMNINPKECKILLTEPPMNPIKNREKMIEVSETPPFFRLGGVADCYYDEKLSVLSPMIILFLSSKKN